MEYDELGRVIATTDTADTPVETQFTYDLAGNRITATDGKSQATTYVYDARGRQISQIDRLSETTSFTYLPTGQLESLTDAENQTTTYTYDDAGGKLTEQYPDHTGGSPGDSTYGIVSFELDAAGRVFRKEDQKGDTCTYNYDLAGRLTSRVYRTAAEGPTGNPADTDTFTYDPSGRMLTAVSGRYSNTVAYTYDSAGRKKTESLTISGEIYTTEVAYNARGELIGYEYPDGALVERTYTDRGQLYQIKHDSTVIDTRTYDDGGRMTGSEYNNDVEETRAYNDDNTLASISFSGASIGNMTYSWDDNKNKTAEEITDTMENYGFTIPTGGYDAEDRLIEYERTSGLDQSWSLSEVGNWNSVVTNNVEEGRTHTAAHELSNLVVVSQIGQPASVVIHDVKGNMTSIPAVLGGRGQELSLTWDFDNRMVDADVGNNSSVDVSHKYDALGRRVARTEDMTTVVFVQFGQQTICDYPLDADPALRTYRYLYASYIDEPIMRWETAEDEPVYYHRNQQYSVIAVTDDSGDILERYSYSAYGVPTLFDGSGSPISDSAVSNRYTYTGREYDSIIRLYHYRARMYDPQLGRFLGRDPIGFEGSQWNIFEYCNASPLQYMDYSGLGCRLCTFLESVEEIKDDSGKVIACGLIFKVTDESKPKQYNGGWTDKCKDCKPVLDCSDIPGLSTRKFTKLMKPKEKGFPGFRTSYCPPIDEWPGKHCFGIIAKDCASDFEKDFKDCLDLCESGGYAKYLCKGFPIPFKQACEQWVSQSKELCVYFCENSRIVIDE